MLETLPDARVSLLVVWEPVLITDIAPPTSHALSRISDPRAVQLWDAGRALSRAMSGGDGEIVWDHLAIYPPQLLWKEAPPPSLFEAGPVVDVIDEARTHLVAGNGP